MSKTYRHVPSYELEENENSKKIKRIDKKHQIAEVTDGVFSHNLEEGDVICGTPEQKKIAKKITKKHERTKNSQINIED